MFQLSGTYPLKDSNATSDQLKAFPIIVALPAANTSNYQMSHRCASDPGQTGVSGLPKFFPPTGLLEKIPQSPGPVQLW